MGNAGQGQSRVDQFPTYVMSGQVVGLVSGTVYSLPDQPCTDIIIIGHPSNQGTAWVGNVTGTVNGGNGYPLKSASGNPMVFSGVSNLNYIKVNFDTAGDKLCWIAEVLE